MRLLELFEKLNLNKSKKLIYEFHHVLYLKFDTNKRIGIVFQNVDMDVSQVKKFHGFYTRSLKEKNQFYIQTDGNLAQREIFCHMIDYILNEIKSLKNLDSRDINDAIKGWVNFGRSSQNNLAESIQIGLFGELLFLQFVRNYLNEKDSIVSWHGPERKKVDFVLSENMAVEIKAITDRLSKKVSISSIQQLSDGYENHFMRVYKLVKSPSGKKLNELFSEVLSVFSDDAKEDLINKCCDYGFNYLLEYDNLKPISNMGYHDYIVSDDDFPKMTGELDPRIIEVKYTISLENQKCLDLCYLSGFLNTSNK